MKVWSLLDLHVNHNRYGLSLRGRRRGSDHDYNTKSEQILAMAALPARMAVVLEGEADAERIGAALQNCIVIRPPQGIADGLERQLHFLPLNLWPGILAWYRDRSSWKEIELKDVPIEAPCIYIEGQPFDFDAVCKACPFYMEKSLDLCRPLHSSCRLEQAPFFSKEPNEKLLGWLKAHPMRTDAMPADFTFKEARKISDRDSFEKLSCASLTGSEEKWHELHADRSERSKTAALTQRYTKFICKGCLRSNINGSFCSSRGGQDCKSGPYVESDFKHWAEACEPWMVHALALGQESFDARKDIISWKNGRTKAYSIVCARSRTNVDFTAKSPWSNAKRWVDVCKECRHYFSVQPMPYELACERLGEKPVESWRDLSWRGKKLWFMREPIPGFVKALAYLLYMGAGRSGGRSSGWGGGGHYTLCEIRPDSRWGGGEDSHEFTLKYRTYHDSTTRNTVRKIEDLFHMSRVEFSAANFSKERVMENAELKRMVCEQHVNIDGQRWRKLHREAHGNPLEAKALRKMLAKERREAKLQSETERDKAARKAKRLEARNAVRASPAVVAQEHEGSLA